MTFRPPVNQRVARSVQLSAYQDFFNSSEVQLIGQDTFFGAAGEVQDYDLTNPVLRKWQGSFYSFVQTTSLALEASVASPIKPNDWQNPKGRAPLNTSFQNQSLKNSLVVGSVINGTTSSSASVTCSTVTAAANSTLFLAISTNISGSTPATISSVTDTSGVTNWQRYASQSFTDSSGRTQTLELWWTYAPSSVSTTVTVNATATASALNAKCWNVLGLLSPSNPFDPNASLPAYANNPTATGTTVAISGISTYYNNTTLFEIACNDSLTSVAIRSDRTSLGELTNGTNPTGSALTVSYGKYLTTQNNISDGLDSSVQDFNWGLIVFGVTSDPAQNPPASFDYPNPVRRKYFDYSFFASTNDTLATNALVNITGAVATASAGYVQQFGSYVQRNGIYTVFRRNVGFDVPIRTTMENQGLSIALAPNPTIPITGVQASTAAGNVTETIIQNPPPAVFDFKNPLKNILREFGTVQSTNIPLFNSSVSNTVSITGVVATAGAGSPQQFGSYTQRGGIYTVFTRNIGWDVPVRTTMDQQSPGLGLSSAVQIAVTGVVATTAAGAPVQPIPAINYDFPNPQLPRRAYPYHIDFMVLSMQDKFFGTNGQVPTYSWQNDLPVRAKNRNEYGFVTGMPETILNYNNVNLTGASASTVAGNIVPNAAAQITGVVASTAAGTVSNIIAATNITGVVASTSAGTLSNSLTVGPLTGVVASVNLGQQVYSIVINISGVAATTSVGNVIAKEDIAVTGVVATTSVGSTASLLQSNPTGVVGTTSAGTITPDVLITPVGAAASTAVGLFSFGSNISFSVVGAAATALVGSVAITSSPNVAITSIPVFASAGNISPFLSSTIVGALASASVGVLSFTGQVNIQLPGVVGTTSPGTLSTINNTNTNVTGAAATSVAGNVSVATTTTVAGAVATAISGNAGVSTGAQITGVSASSSAGIVSDIIQKALAGAQVIASAGHLIDTTDANVFTIGAFSQANVGTVLGIGSDGELDLNLFGVSAQAEAANITAQTANFNIKRIFTMLSIPTVLVDIE